MPLLKSSIPELQNLSEAERHRVLGEAVDNNLTILVVGPGVVAVVYASVARSALHSLPTFATQLLDSLINVPVWTAVIMGGAALLRLVFVLYLRRAIRDILTRGG